MSRASVLAQNDQEVQDYVLAFKARPNGPTRPQFAVDDSLASTEFVKKSGITLSGFSTYNASATMPNSVAGSVVEFYGATAGQTLILPLASAARVADVITIFNFATVAVTITKQGAESIFFGANSTGNSLLLQPGDSLILVAGGTQWYVIGGTAANKFSDSFGSSRAVNGYQKLPTGLIIQWGQNSTSASGYTPITFPIAFPGVCYNVVGSVLSTSAANNTFLFNIPGGGATFNAACANSANAFVVVTMNWLSLGQ